MTLKDKVEIFKQRAKKLESAIDANNKLLHRNCRKSAHVRSTGACGAAKSRIAYFTDKLHELRWFIDFLESTSPDVEEFLKHGIES